MKRLRMRSNRRPQKPEILSALGGRSRPFAVACLVAATAVVPIGCVSTTQFDEVSEKSRQLEERVVVLGRSNESLDSERIALIAQNDDLLTEQKGLYSKIAELERGQRRVEAELSENRDQLEARSYEVESLRTTYEGLVGDLEAEVASGSIEIQRLKGGVEVNVSDEILFQSGEAELSRSGRAILLRLAPQLANGVGRVQVRGHTDNVRIRGDLSRRFPSNWELAAARATAVVRLLEEAGVSGNRLSAVSRGPYDPLQPNDDAAARAKNRRIEIRLLPAPPEVSGEILEVESGSGDATSGPEP